MKKIWRSGLLGLAVVLLAPAAQAQQQPVVAAATGQAYQFMQLTVLEGAPGYLSFSPEFNGQKIVKLEDVYMNQLYNAKFRQTLQGNEDKVMRSLQDVSGAGWELVQVSSQAIRQADEREVTQTRYLFRKAK
jgi:hypothetical protein